MPETDRWPHRDTFRRLVSEWRRANPEKTLEDLAALWPMKMGSFRAGLMYGRRRPTDAVLLRAAAVFGVHPAILMGDRFPELPGLTPEYLQGLDPLQRYAFLEAVEIFMKLPPSRLPAAVEILRNAARLADPLIG